MGLRKYNVCGEDDTWSSGSTMTVEETIPGAQEVRVWRRRHLGLRKYNDCGGNDTWGSGSIMSVEETTLGAQEVQ